jgi:hypothetical protein
MPVGPLDPNSPFDAVAVARDMNATSRGDWEVEVWGGFPMENDRIESPPLRFGTPYIVAGEEGDLRQPLAYGPVVLRGDSNELRMQVPRYWADPHGQPLVYDSYDDIRLLMRPTYEWDWSNSIRVEGFEVGPDNALRAAVWTITRYEADDRSSSGE